MAVTVNAYGHTLKKFLAQEVALSQLKCELLSNSAVFNVSHTGKHQVDNGATPATVTITIASPGVINWTAHGFAANQPVKFSTTGALPTGLSPNTYYYVLAAGLTTNAFEVAATPGGAAINTSGTQSGVHTGYAPGTYEVSGNGWPLGGPTLTGLTFSIVALNDATANDCKMTADNLDQVASGGTIGPAYKALVYDSSLNTPLFFIDFGQAQSAGDTTDFKVVWNASGLWNFTL